MRMKKDPDDMSCEEDDSSEQFYTARVTDHFYTAQSDNAKRDEADEMWLVTDQEQAEEMLGETKVSLKENAIYLANKKGEEQCKSFLNFFRHWVLCAYSDSSEEEKFETVLYHSNDKVCEFFVNFVSNLIPSYHIIATNQSSHKEAMLRIEYFLDDSDNTSLEQGYLRDSDDFPKFVMSQTFCKDVEVLLSNETQVTWQIYKYGEMPLKTDCQLIWKDIQSYMHSYIQTLKNTKINQNTLPSPHLQQLLRDLERRNKVYTLSHLKINLKDGSYLGFILQLEPSIYDDMKFEVRDMTKANGAICIDDKFIHSFRVPGNHSNQFEHALDVMSCADLIVPENKRHAFEGALVKGEVSGLSLNENGIINYRLILKYPSSESKRETDLICDFTQAQIFVQDSYNSYIQDFFHEEEKGGGVSNSIEIVSESELKKEKTLTSGAFGDVCHYEWTSSKSQDVKKIVVKSMRDCRQGNRKCILLFLKEIQLHWGLERHDNIVTCLGATQLTSADNPLMEELSSPTSWGLLLERMPGGNLEEHIIKYCTTKLQDIKCGDEGLEPLAVLYDFRDYYERLLDDYERLTENAIIMLGIANGIQHLHANHIAHFDIKPANVLIPEGGDFSKVKLCDLGISRYLDGKETIRFQSGTPGYMAPELLGAGQGGKKSDIYSFGVLVFRLLFPKELRRETKKTRWEILDNCPTLLYETVRLLLRDSCWQSDQKNRCDAKELVKTLEKYQTELPNKIENSIEIYKRFKEEEEEEEKEKEARERLEPEDQSWKVDSLNNYGEYNKPIRINQSVGLCVFKKIPDQDDDFEEEEEKDIFAFIDEQYSFT